MSTYAQVEREVAYANQWSSVAMLPLHGSDVSHDLPPAVSPNRANQDLRQGDLATNAFDSKPG
jgi:hypothetical protein